MNLEIENTSINPDDIRSIEREICRFGRPAIRIEYKPRRGIAIIFSHFESEEQRDQKFLELTEVFFKFYKSKHEDRSGLY